MRQSCWQVWPDRGFLINPDPLPRLCDALDGLPIAASELAHAEALASELPDLIADKRLREALDELPVVDLWPLHPELDQIDFRVIERLMQMYSYFASAYVFGGDPVRRIPSGVALPLVQLADMVERPPILSYAGYGLCNWERIDSSKPISIDNTRIVQSFLGISDEAWFIRVHVEIEAHAAEGLFSIQKAVHALDDIDTLEAALASVVVSVTRMIETFRRMAEGCDSDVYYHQMRPYMFGFTDIIYEGAFGDQPQSFRGQTAAQSSIIPALVAALGVQHETTSLTQHLDIMKDYMPKPHRELIARLHESGIRAAVIQHRDNRPLAEVYNECLRKVLAFRQLHYRYAMAYIGSKNQNATGTGGTNFMEWLKHLIDETERQLV
ncbi:MAG TPA: hypothetical protein VHD90_26505 [Phototrophicaceae bacterium]|nr:hypothetical protein [Phototrophicaceae bacterium]